MKNRFYGFIRGLLYVPFKLIYPTRVVHKDNMPKSGRLITVSNHLSWMDIPVLAINVPGYRHFIAKKEIGNKKTIRSLAKKLGVIFVDRSKADMTAIRESIKALKADEGLSIFPEGTRNKTDDNLHEIKGGVTMMALKGDAPIVPILIHRKQKAFHKNYMYIGKPFDLNDFKGLRLDGEVIGRAAEVVAAKMQNVKSELDDYVANKRWIEEKKQATARRKELKTLNRQARKEYRAYRKSLKKKENR